MTSDVDNLFVVTGGPGSGKTTLIDAVARRGVFQSMEAGRGIIRDQVAIGGSALPWSDAEAFADLMLSWDMRSYRMARAQAGPAIFDRGIPDVVGYLRTMELPVPPYLDRAARLFRYNRHVFIAPPWPEIFVRDAERTQTLDDAERTYRAVVETYEGYGYVPLPLPFASVDDRVTFVMQRIDRAGQGENRQSATGGPRSGS